MIGAFPPEKIMKIRFLADCELEVVESYDEEKDVATTTSERFNAGDEVDVDITDEYETTTTWQFGDGSLACAVPNELFEKAE